MKKILILIAVLAVIGAAITAAVIRSNNRRIIAPNDPYLAGNSGGNLTNGGLFCEAGGKVYFANSFDGGALYVMDVDETQLKKLGTFNARSINIGGDFLYFCQEQTVSGGVGLALGRLQPGLYRIRTDGRDANSLKLGVISTAALCGNDIFYLNFTNLGEQRFTTLYRINTDGTDDGEWINEIIQPASYANGFIYYARAADDDHSIYALDTQIGYNSLVLDGNTFNAVYDGGYIYYLDLANNYRLCRYQPPSGQVEVLTSDRVEVFNVGHGVIFYQRYSRTEPALIRMYDDGSNPEAIAPGNYTAINLTSRFAYYKLFGDDTVTYRTALYGAATASPFTVAQVAVE